MKTFLSVLTLVLAFSINSKAQGIEVEWNECLEKIDSKWGEDVGTCRFKHDTYQVILKNVCTSNIDVMVCVQEEDKTWRCFSHNGVPPKDELVAYACKGTGKYLKFVKSSTDESTVLPTVDQVNELYRE